MFLLESLHHWVIGREGYLRRELHARPRINLDKTLSNRLPQETEGRVKNIQQLYKIPKTNHIGVRYY